MQTCSKESMTFIREWLTSETGIVLGENKEYVIASRLESIIQASPNQSLDALCEQLRSSPQSELQARVINALANHETSFMRDRLPFTAMKKLVRSEFIGRKSPPRTLRIWSAAASTGQEAYSIAITLAEVLKDFDEWNISILGTDVCPQVLEKGRSGIYDLLDVNRGMSFFMLLKYFQQQGRKWRVNQNLRHVVHFTQGNLLKDSCRLGPFDFIFLRNVLIYFNLADKRRVLGNIRRQLAPDGYLVLGSSESVFGVDPHFNAMHIDKSIAYSLGD